MQLSLSLEAEMRLKEIIPYKPEGTFLRVEVVPGGCQGFNVKFTLDQTVNDDDVIFDTNGIKLVSDKTSLNIIDGSIVEFSNNLMGKYFWLNISKAKSKCSCGSSFSL